MKPVCWRVLVYLLTSFPLRVHGDLVLVRRDQVPIPATDGSRREQARSLEAVNGAGAGISSLERCPKLINLNLVALVVGIGKGIGGVWPRRSYVDARVVGEPGNPPVDT
jgi:hypothetical protein